MLSISCRSHVAPMIPWTFIFNDSRCLHHTEEGTDIGTDIQAQGQETAQAPSLYENKPLFYAKIQEVLFFTPFLNSIKSGWLIQLVFVFRHEVSLWVQ